MFLIRQQNLNLVIVAINNMKIKIVCRLFDTY